MNTKLIYVTAINLFLIYACKRGDPCEGMDLSPINITYNVADSNKAKIPYTGNDTLIFVSDAKDTAVLIGQGKKPSYISVNNRTGSVDCPKYNNYNYENIDYIFKDTNFIFSNFRFTISRYDLSYMPTTSIMLTVNNNEVSHTSIVYLSSLVNVDDSIALNGKYVNGMYWEFNSNKTTLFSFKYGLLKFQYNNRDWILNSIKQ